MKLKDLFYELLAIPLLVPLLHNSVYAFWNNNCNNATDNESWWFCYESNNVFYTSQSDQYFNTATIVDSDWNFNTDWVNIFWRVRDLNIWWNQYRESYFFTRWVDWLYYYASRINNSQTTWWKFNQVLEINYTWDYLNCNVNPCKSITFEEFSNLNLWWLITDFSYYKNKAIYDWTFCFWVSSLWKSYCFRRWTNNNSSNRLIDFISVWNLQYPYNFSELSSKLTFWLSPFTSPWWWWWSSRWDLVELDSPYTVSDIIYAYWNNWYTNWLCYWNFAINDLASSWSIDQFFDFNLEDGVYFTWANIIDLYKSFSWNNSFSVFYNSWFARFYPSYSNNTALWFIWFPKALWYNQYLIYIHRSTIKDFSYNHLYNYCSLAIALDKWSISLDDNFNKEMINNWSLPTSVEEELTDSNNSVLVPWEDSIFNWSWFVPWFWWAWWWWRSWSEWDEPSDAYWLFSRLYDYISWLSGDFDLWLTTKWVLPSIIQFWFLVALLYYILKR